MQIKYCGLRTADDLCCAAECGVTYCGLMFYKQSPRYISKEEAQILLEQVRGLPGLPRMVGVFVDASSEEIEDTAEALKLDRVQIYRNYPRATVFSRKHWTALRVQCKEDLHYIEQLSKIRAAKQWKTGVQNSESRHIEAAFSINMHQLLSSEAFLIDVHAEGSYGGTGKSFNWDWLDELNIVGPYFIAGGIRLDNLEILLEKKPYGIDLSSGIELERGKKHHQYMREFAEKVRKFYI